MVIDTIPESIPRDTVLRVLESIGIETKWCISLELKRDGLYAEMIAKSHDGHKIILEDELATHKVFIEFT